MKPPAAGSEQGFSLTELLVCMGLTAMALLAAWGLWDDALHLIAGTGRALHNPTFAAARAQIRRDIHAAIPTTDDRSGWTGRALELTHQDGRVIVYQRRPSGLWRTVRGDADAEISRTRVLDRVVGWRWRQHRPGLVDIRLELSLYPGPERVIGRRYSAPSQPPTRSTQTMRIAMRGGGGGTTW